MADAVCSVDSSEGEEEDDEDEVGREEERSSQERGDGADEHHYRWWHVNKTGFPIAAETWERMWDHVIQVHPQGTQIARSIRDTLVKKVDMPKELVFNFEVWLMLCFRTQVPFPSVPTLSSATPPIDGLLAVQAYLKQLQYPL